MEPRTESVRDRALGEGRKTGSCNTADELVSFALAPVLEMVNNEELCRT